MHSSSAGGASPPGVDGPGRCHSMVRYASIAYVYDPSDLRRKQKSWFWSDSTAARDDSAVRSSDMWEGSRSVSPILYPGQPPAPWCGKARDAGWWCCGPAAWERCGWWSDSPCWCASCGWEGTIDEEATAARASSKFRRLLASMLCARGLSILPLPLPSPPPPAAASPSPPGCCCCGRSGLRLVVSEDPRTSAAPSCADGGRLAKPLAVVPLTSPANGRLGRPCGVPLAGTTWFVAALRNEPPFAADGPVAALRNEFPFVGGGGYITARS